MHGAGLPPGVFDLIHGTGPEAGAALSRHRGVGMMSFTGCSIRGGLAVERDAAETVERVTPKLGGKSPDLVFAGCVDVLADRAASVAGVTLDSGRSRDGPDRMPAKRTVHDRACALADVAADATVVGDTARPGDRIGPLVASDHRNRVQRFVDGAIADALVRWPEARADPRN